MKKIGLIIGKTEGDVKFYVSESAKEWLVGVDEPRVEAGKVTSKSSDIVDFVCYRDGVALLYFYTDDLTRVGERLYGVITIPAGIDIDGVTLENIVNEAKIDCEKCFFNPSESTKEIFNSRFGKEYPECSNRVTCQNSKNNTTFAYQKYGKSINYTYGEILERNLFSPCYNSHKAVFLISDEDVNNIIPKDGVVELTQKEVASHAILKYPTGCPYKLTIDGSPFDKDRVVTIGSIVKIHAERRGKNHYDPQEISVPINAQRVDITSTINGLTWNLRISKSWFEVVEFSKNTPIANFTIKINDKALLDYQHMSIPEADVKMANVVIEAPGYDSDAFILGTEIGKLQSESSKIKRVLKESAKMYEYIVENKNRRKPVKFSIPDASYDEKLSPLEGYTVVKSIPKPDNQGTQIILRQKAGISKMLLAIIVGVSLLLIGASFWAGWQFAQNNTTNTTEESKSSNLGENTSSDKGGDKGHGQIKKLLSNRQWNKDAFEKAGYGKLWKVVDQYEYDEIAKIVEELKDNGIGIPEGPGDDTYQSWNEKVVDVVKDLGERRNKPNDPVSKGKDLDLGKWSEAVKAVNKENSKDDSATERIKTQLATEQVPPAGAGDNADNTSYSSDLKTILQSKKWERSKFKKHESLWSLWSALFDYNLDDIKKVKGSFDKITQGYIGCWEEYSEKLSEITNYTNIKSNSDEVEAWKWRENIKLTIIYALLKDENWDSKYFQNSILVVNEKNPKILLSDLFDAVKNGNGNKIKECIEKIESRLENILEIEHVNALYDLCKDTSIEPTIIAEWAKEHITD